jgi:glyoxylase-like metal-dependent hydrolase (beta-lactamase superfamily II)
LTATPNQTNTVVLSSHKGLIVIDTNRSHSYAAEIRKLASKEFGRRDFAYIVNTHGNWDHVGGNQIFADCMIIGHERCIEGMRQFEALLADIIAEGRQDEANTKEALETLDSNSEEANILKVDMSAWKTVYDDYEDGFVLTPPNVTFNDRLTVDLDDLTLKLFYFGEAHTNHDIIIHVEEEGLIAVGDLLYFKRLLPPFAIGEVLDVPRWTKSLNALLDKNSHVEHIIPGHGDIMTRNELTLWRDYIVELWEGMTVANEEGLGFEVVKERYSLKNRFAYLGQLGLDPAELEEHHELLVKAFWRQFQE